MDGLRRKPPELWAKMDFQFECSMEQGSFKVL